jgi:CRP-like cAMP-binding protein
VHINVGGIFGEVGIINSLENPAEVRALEDSILLEFAEHTFLNLLKRSNEMTFTLLKVLTHNLRLTNENR